VTRLPAPILARLAATALGGSSFQDLLKTLAQIAVDALPGAEAVSITLLRGHDAATAAYTAKLALELDETQYDSGYGPCVEAAQCGILLEITHMPTESRWPAYAARATELGVMSTLSVPLPIQTHVIGALNVYSRRPEPFTATEREIAVDLAGCLAVACANAEAYADAVEQAEQMRAAMASRATIEQAKGMIMVQNRCSAEEAFEILRGASTSRNVKLRDIAEDMVRAVAKAPDAPAPSPGALY
jgi:AmiR/NasT family two-component response regulator